MNSRERRVRKLADEMTRAEYRRLRRMYEETAADYGITADELLDEARRFLSQPLADQLAEMDQLKVDLEAEGFNAEDIEGMKATLIREYRP